MSDLFDMEAVKMDSPRLAWIKKHKAVTHFAKHCDEAPWTATFRQDEQENLSPAEIIMKILENSDSCAVGFGATENEALQNAAINWSIPLWNETP